MKEEAEVLVFFNKDNFLQKIFSNFNTSPSPTKCPPPQIESCIVESKQSMADCVGCCHQNGPPGPLKYWKCIWDEKELGIERDFELMGMEKRRLLRLRPDYKDEGAWFPTSRVEYMTVVAREALRDGHAEIVGGFIRDWIIRGEVDTENGTPKDIDLRLWQGFDIQAFEKRCLAWGLKRDYRHEGVLGFRTPTGEYFFIDYVFTDVGHKK